MPYMYHMYMALLAGGQIIKRGVVKSFSLREEQLDGVNTFHFEHAKQSVSLNMYSSLRYSVVYMNKFSGAESEFERKNQYIGTQ